MNPPNYDWSQPQRQAIAGLLIIIYKAIVQLVKMLWPILAVIIFRTGKKGLDSFEILIAGIAVFVLIKSLLDFFYFRFFVTNDELIIRKGFISRKTITIPLERIQAVHMEQNVLHQVMEVYKVKIDTAGTDKNEAEIDALQKRKAEQLKAFLMEENKEVESAGLYKESPVLPVIRLSTADLFRMGITANHIQAFFIVLAFTFSIFRNIQDVLGEDAINRIERSELAMQAMRSIPMLVLFVFVISVIVSLVRIALQYYDFTLAETAQGYRLKTGLLNTRQFLVPFSKVQFISWEANWLRRKIGLYNLEFHQVGEKQQEKQKVKVPIARVEDIEKLLTNYGHAISSTAHSVHYIHKVYPFRRMLLAGIIPVALLLPIIWVAIMDYWVWLILLWMPFVFFTAYFFRQNFRLFLAPDALQVYSGVWGRENKLVKWYKIQHIELQQSLYQRRKALATVKLYTAGGTIRIPYISLELAQKISNYALYEIERSPRAWL